MLCCVVGLEGLGLTLFARNLSSVDKEFLSSGNNPIIIVHKLFSKSWLVSSCVEREE